MPARIYCPTKTAMQSGHANSGTWILEHEAQAARKIEPLMGYTSSSDMNSQVRLSFSSKELAMAYAEKHGIAYRVQVPQQPRRRKMAYSDNFAFNRALPWTH